MNVLVAGGAGYIGSHVVLELLEAGHQVVVLDNLSSGHEINLFPAAHFAKLDLLDRAGLQALFEVSRFDAVVHLAALKAANDSMHQPERYSHQNITGSLNLIQAASAGGVRLFAFSSSAAVYGEPEYLPVDEQHPCRPENYYGFTKLQIEQQLAWFSRLRGMRCACLRYFNAAGYDIEGRVRGLERDPRNLIPIVLEVAVGLRPQLDIFGQDYDTPDGTCLRDYVHVSDLARAHVQVLEHMAAHDRDLTLNLGSDEGHSVTEVLKVAEQVVGHPLPHAYVARRAGDPARLIASSARARQLLGWSPRHSSLETMIASAWQVSSRSKHQEA